MKDTLKQFGNHLISIIMTAIIAGLITYLQGILLTNGSPIPPNETIETAGILGATLKTAHSSFILLKGIV